MQIPSARVGGLAVPDRHVSLDAIPDEVGAIRMPEKQFVVVVTP